ncbi:hypothetical protein PUN28_007155 [Cardiocondyla obscurior]|uniref:Uncharacterized protein n=1 Tax=Cardiocondyla obscurior TaxID=286306 RepID=A0AAW2G3Q2_9HYME
MQKNRTFTFFLGKEEALLRVSKAKGVSPQRIPTARQSRVSRRYNVSDCAIPLSPPGRIEYESNINVLRSAYVIAKYLRKQTESAR